MVRIGGLASGMDIDQLVSDLMKAERIPLDKMEQKKQTLEWQRNDYREMNKLLFELNNAAFDMTLSSSYRTKKVTSTDDSKISATASPNAGNTTYSITKVGQLATSAYNVGTAETTIDPSKTLWSQRGLMPTVEGDGSQFWDDTYVDTVNVSVKGSEFKLSNKFIKKDTLPNDGTNDFINVYKAGSGTADPFKVVYDSPDNLTENEVYVNLETGEMQFGTDLDAGSRIETSYTFYNKDTRTVSTDDFSTMKLSKIGINEVNLVVTDKDENNVIYSSVVDKSSLDPTKNQYFIDKDTGEITFSHTIPKDYKVDVSYTNKTFDFSITTYDTSGNEVKQTFNIDGDSTLDTLIYTINNSDVGVSSFYDESSKQVTFNRSQTGDLNPPSDPNNPTVDDYEMKFSGSFLSNVLHLDQTKEVDGKDATFILNGLSTSRHTNTFEVNGVTFTLKDTFDATSTNPTPDAAVMISTTTDTDKVFENIKSFVEKYNEVIGKINDEINEDRYRKYQPLTSAQREAMEDKEIELWEEKAKSGMLRSDSILQGGLYRMRSDFYSNVTTGGLYNNLTDIGVKTTYWGDNGKLEIDETKLKEALNKDPDAVYKLFAGDGPDDEKGIIRRFRDTLDATMDKIESKAGNSGQVNNRFLIGKNLDELNDRMEAFEDHLVQIEDRYWRQFTAMEQAIQRSNQQSMFLMNQFGGGM